MNVIEQHTNSIKEDEMGTCTLPCLIYTILYNLTDPTCYNAMDSWQCAVWANQGECQRNPRFMLESCKKACRLCGDSEEKDGKLLEKCCSLVQFGIVTHFTYQNSLANNKTS